MTPKEADILDSAATMLTDQARRLEKQARELRSQASLLRRMMREEDDATDPSPGSPG